MMRFSQVKAKHDKGAVEKVSTGGREESGRDTKEPLSLTQRHGSHLFVCWAHMRFLYA